MARTKQPRNPQTHPYKKVTPVPIGSSANLIKLPGNSAVPQPLPQSVIPPEAPVDLFINYTHSNPFNSCVIRVNHTPAMLSELTCMLRSIRSPVLLDKLIANEPFAQRTFTRSERDLLLAFLNKLGIFTTEEDFNADDWDTVGLRCSLTTPKLAATSTRMCHVIWIVDLRRNFPPTKQDLEWVDEYRASLKSDSDSAEFDWVSSYTGPPASEEEAEVFED